MREFVKGRVKDYGFYIVGGYYFEEFGLSVFFWDLVLKSDLVGLGGFGSILEEFYGCLVDRVGKYYVGVSFSG